MMTKEPLEREIQSQIVSALRAAFPLAIVAAIPNGGKSLAHRLAKGRQGELPGMPDLLMGFRSEVIFFEVKRKKGRVSKNQQIIHDALRLNDIPCYVVRDVFQALAAAGQHWGYPNNLTAEEWRRKFDNAY